MLALNEVPRLGIGDDQASRAQQVQQAFASDVSAGPVQRRNGKPDEWWGGDVFHTRSVTRHACSFLAILKGT